MLTTISRYFPVMFFVLMITTGSTPAQSLQSFGIKAGVVAANQTWQASAASLPATSYRFGPTGGIYIEGASYRGLSMMAELLYTQKGFKSSVDTTIIGISETVSPRFIYISFPILLKYRIPFEDFTMFIVAGPRIDYLYHLNAERMKGIDEVFSEGDSDIGLITGTGIEFPLFFINRFQWEVRFNPSVVNAVSSEQLKVRNSSFEMLIGIGL